MADYKIVSLEEVDDWLGDYPGEMRGITYAIGSEQVALTYRRMPQHTGSKGSYGHRHKEQEELYFVLNGRLQFKLGDEIVELGLQRGQRHVDHGRVEHDHELGEADDRQHQPRVGCLTESVGGHEEPWVGR